MYKEILSTAIPGKVPRQAPKILLARIDRDLNFHLSMFVLFRPEA